MNETYWYLYDLTDNKPINASYLLNKLGLYTKHESAKRGLTYIKNNNWNKHEYEIREIEI